MFYAFKIRQSIISRLNDPKRRLDQYLKQMQVSGKAYILITVTGAGTVSGASIYRSSGNRIADQLALKLIMLSAPFPPTPDANTLRFLIPLTFEPHHVKPELRT
ncbi:TonB family protein [Acidiphilium sp. PA]|uniref:TonB family protein n=1 Tax=Acidiphilium sp. PA TaxID=2871705 RepID=UPI0038CFDB86